VHDARQGTGKYKSLQLSCIQSEECNRTAEFDGPCMTRAHH